VFNYSGGAHVFKNSTQYDQFIDFCDKQVKLSNKAVFTYTLCKQSEFDSFVPVDETEVTTANNTTTELPNNPAINWEVGKTVDKGSLVDNKVRVDWIITNDTEPGHYKSRLDYGYISGTENVDVRDTYGQAWEIDEDIDSDRLVKILKFRAQEKFDSLKDS
jgi:hypothetical protein